jgi:hypothetical protein
VKQSAVENANTTEDGDAIMARGRAALEAMGYDLRPHVYLEQTVFVIGGKRYNLVEVADGDNRATPIPHP